MKKDQEFISDESQKSCLQRLRSCSLQGFARKPKCLMRMKRLGSTQKKLNLIPKELIAFITYAFFENKIIRYESPKCLGNYVFPFLIRRLGFILCTVNTLHKKISKDN